MHSCQVLAFESSTHALICLLLKHVSHISFLAREQATGLSPELCIIQTSSHEVSGKKCWGGAITSEDGS